GATLANSQVEPTVELDEILRIFNPATKDAYRQWVAESAAQIKNGGGQDLNDALGNLATFAVNGEGVLQVLNAQQGALKKTITNPLVTNLKPVADNLGPTVRDLGDLAPDLTRLFRRMDPLITVGKADLPDAQRFLTGASPLFDGLHTFLPELNPILSFANFD